jgi:hypothetical protein
LLGEVAASAPPIRVLFYRMVELDERRNNQ